MDKIELEVQKRDTLGKKVRFLRREGVTPVNLYGHGVKSTSLQVGTLALRKALAQAGMTNLIYVKIDGHKQHHLTVVRSVQRGPVKGELLHVDLYQVRMDRKLKIEVPVVIVGKSPAVKDQGGIMVQEMNTVEVECLPAHMVHSIEADVSGLVNLEQALHVRDLKVGEGVAIVPSPDKVVVKIARLRAEVVEEAAPVAGAEEAAKGAEEAPAATAEAEKKPAAAAKKSAA